jgi:hypothetical protein
MTTRQDRERLFLKEFGFSPKAIEKVLLDKDRMGLYAILGAVAIMSKFLVERGYLDLDKQE